MRKVFWAIDRDICDSVKRRVSAEVVSSINYEVNQLIWNPVDLLTKDAIELLVVNAVNKALSTEVDL